MSLPVSLTWQVIAVTDVSEILLCPKTTLFRSSHLLCVPFSPPSCIVLSILSSGKMTELAYVLPGYGYMREGTSFHLLSHPTLSGKYRLQNPRSAVLNQLFRQNLH